MRATLPGAVVVAVLCVIPVAVAQSPRPQAPSGTQRGATSEPAAPQPVLPRGDIEHGRYIVERVAMCVECHSGRDANGTILDSRRYLGGSIPFAPPWPNDWATRAPRNAGLPGYTDAMALRLLTEGAIGRDGERLKPPMPQFRMSVQDAADVIAFLRSLR